MNETETWHPSVSRIQRPALLVGLVGLALCVLAFFLGDESREMLLRSYLWAYMFWLGLPLGCFALLMLQHLTGGRWGLTVRRIVEAGAAMMPLMALLFIPLFFSVGTLYPWAQHHDGGAAHGDPEQHAAATAPKPVELASAEPTGVNARLAADAVHPATTTTASDAAAGGPVGAPPADTHGGPTAAGPKPGTGAVQSAGHHELHGFKAWWLNATNFRIRAVIYFVVWLLLSFLLLSWSAAEDRRSDPAILRRMQLVSGPGLVLYVLTVTGAAIDWIMSLDPHWFSTMFGLLFVVGQVLSALAFICALMALLHDAPPLNRVVNPGLLQDLGNLLMAFTLIWAYLNFSQFLIIWSGNIAEETPYYYFRLHGGWQYVALFLVIFHWAVPFALLLWRRNKRDVKTLAVIALWLIVMRWVDLYWTIIPTFLQAGHDVAKIAADDKPHVPGLGAGLYWTLPLALAGMGGLWLFLFAGRLKRRPLLPLHDARLAEVHAHGH